MLRLTAPILFFLIAAACSPVSPQASTTTSRPPSSTTTTDAGIDDICVTGDLAFGTDGLIAAVGEDVGDASKIDRIRWDGAGTCERITIAFTNENGAPATTIGPTGVSVLSFAGIVRIVVPPEITTTAVADTLFEGSLAQTAYVVRDSSGGFTIDIQGAEGIPIQARAFATTSPATLVVDIARGPGPSVPAGVTASTTAVVITPVPGPNLYPVTTEGYAAPGLRSIHLLLDGGDGVEQDRSIALDGSPDAWQAFRTVTPDGPSGQVKLFVGTVDANARPLEGATISIDLP